MADNKSKADLVYSYTLSKLKYFQSIADTGAGKAVLAELRHGIGREPGEIASLWGTIFDGMPEELLGRSSASKGEWAVYTALTLYALHKQGKEKDMFAEGISVGKAAAGLITGDDDEERVIKRLNTVITAVSPKDLAYHLRGVIQLIKNADISLDHALLAKDLYYFSIPECSDVVKLRWGREFYRGRYNNKKEGKDDEK